MKRRHLAEGIWLKARLAAHAKDCSIFQGPIACANIPSCIFNSLLITKQILPTRTFDLFSFHTHTDEKKTFTLPILSPIDPFLSKEKENRYFPPVSRTSTELLINDLMTKENCKLTFVPFSQPIPVRFLSNLMSTKTHRVRTFPIFPQPPFRCAFHPDT